MEPLNPRKCEGPQRQPPHSSRRDSGNRAPRELPQRTVPFQMPVTVKATPGDQQYPK